MSGPPAGPGRPGRPAAAAWLRAAGGVVARPRLWPTAVRQAVALAPPGWWRRRPFLPVPAPAYLRFRLETMYGGTAPVPEPGDLVQYLEWCREWRRSLR